MSSADKYSWTRTDGKTVKRWRARWNGPDGKERSKRGFDLESLAKAYAADREAEARHGLKLGGVRPTGKTTVETWAKAWLESQEVRPSTLAAYGFCVKRINATFGGRSVAGLRQSEIRAWRRGLLDKYKPSTADQTAAVLAMLLRAAVHDGLIERSPMPPQRSGGGEGRVVDPAQILTLEQVRAWGAGMAPKPHPKRKWLSPAVAVEMPVVAAQLGLRMGELLGLRPEDVDWTGRQVRVDHQLLPTGQYGPPKTAASIRTLPLPLEAQEAMARHLVLQPPVEGEPIFRSAGGRRWLRPNFWELWTQGVEEAELPDWVTWHCLRDVYASSLIFLGQDLRVVMSLMGHASSEETLRTYARLWPSATDSTRKALEGLWRGADSEPDGQAEATKGAT